MACINVENSEYYIHPENGGEYLYAGRAFTYTVSTSDKSIVNSDMIVYLSYTGSTAVQETSFTAPKKVTIPSGSFSVEFEINIILHEDTYQKTIVVAGSSETLDSCGTEFMQILSEKSSPRNEYDEILREPGKECCLFYDKTHEVWRDYYPTCMGSNGKPQFPGNLEKEGTISNYDWYDSELYK